MVFVRPFARFDAAVAFAGLAVAGFASLLGAACGSSSTGRRDAGHRPGSDDCGDLQQVCCDGDSTERCNESGMRCQSSKCCAELDGVACTEDDDCCPNLECQSGSCCVSEGKRCSSNRDCCDGLVCDMVEDECRPEDPPDCGAEGGPCDCFDDRCADGLACIDDVCAPCGGVDEPCCITLDEEDRCRSTLFCELGETSADPDVCRDCGEDGEPCCVDDRDRCIDGLLCNVRQICEGDERCEAETCADCAVDSACGWCESSEECRSARGDCELSQWVERITECPSQASCNEDDDCAACTADDGCGYCKDDGTCSNFRSDCVDWITFSGSCDP